MPFQRAKEFSMNFMAGNMNQNIPSSWICLSAEDLVDLQPAVIEIHFSTAPLTGVVSRLQSKESIISKDGGANTSNEGKLHYS